MPTTPSYAFPFPNPTDPVDVPGDLQDFATAVDTSIGTKSPSSHTHAGFAADGHTHSYAATVHSHSVIPKTTIDAKGDLIVGTGSGTVSRLAAGSNGQVVTANSSTATGLAWAAAPSSGAISVLATGYGNDITNIPQTAKDLIISWRVRTSNQQPIGLRFNGDTTAVYGFWTEAYSTNSSVTSYDTTGTSILLTSKGFDNRSSNIWGQLLIRINNYAESTAGKYCMWRLSHHRDIVTTANEYNYAQFGTGRYGNSTAASTTRLTLVDRTNYGFNWADTEFTVYGVGA